jgi:TetR/AcrR family transcriptional regulator, acrAB operon repressor
MIRAEITGLFENWLCVPDSFNIKENAVRYVDTMIDMMKYSPSLRNS